MNVDVEYYKGLIAQLDNTLNLARGEWMSTTGVKKQEWSGRIDKLLDERVKLMSLRDGRYDE